MDKIKSLRKLLDPQKIAVIGASRSMDKVGGIIFTRLLNSRRRLFPVNPKEIVIQGYKVNPDINSLPNDIDLAIITISAKACVKAVQMCIDKNIQNYIIVAGGFAEVGGNGVDLDEIDFLQYFAKDKKTNCLGFYLENIERGREFLELSKKVAKDKPVVVLKAGRTKTAINAVSSHTGKLAGSDNVINGAFKQFGIQRVYDDEEFCDATKVLSMLKGAPGNRIAVLTAAGGYGVICTDFIEKEDKRAALKMAKLSESTKKKIKESTFSFTACENPVDITASADDLMFSLSLDALIEDSGVDIVICIAFFAPPVITENLIDIIAQKIKQSPKPVIVFTKYGPFTDNSIKNLFYAKVAAYPSVGRAVRAARFLVERTAIEQRFNCFLKKGILSKSHNDQKMKNKLKSWFESLAKKEVIEQDRKGQQEIKHKINSKEDYQLESPDEFDAKKLLNLYSIKVPQGKRFDPQDKLDIDNLDSENINPPYVLKVCSSKILHKTELQGVLLNNDRKSVKENFKEMQKRFPNESILVENQTQFMTPEFIIGIIKDPALGHAIMVGAGGVLTEIYKDASFRLAPCSVDQALEMIDELVLSPVFNNFRGIAFDKEKFAKIISQVSKIAKDFGDRLNQLDINPIVFSNNEWVALDVKIML